MVPDFIRAICVALVEESSLNADPTLSSWLFHSLSSSSLSRKLVVSESSFFPPGDFSVTYPLSNSY